MTISLPTRRPAPFQSVRTSRDLSLVAFAGALLVGFALQAGAFVPRLAPAARLDNAVGVENDQIARSELNRDLVVAHAVEGSEGQPGDLEGGRPFLLGPVVEGVRQARVREAERAVLEVEESVGERAEEALDAPAEQRAVELMTAMLLIHLWGRLYLTADHLRYVS